MPLGQLKQATHQLAAHSFQPGITQNHIYQPSLFIQFCDHYALPFILPSAATLHYYITHLTRHFTSVRSIKNYISRVRFLHKSWA